MSKNYTQLSSEQRYQIEALLQNEATQKEIARIIGVSPSTICRELRRNVPKRGRGALEYRAQNAQRKTEIRHHTKSKYTRFTDEMKIKSRGLLQVQKLSPELIHEQGKVELGDFVSHETLYKWIWKCKASNKREDKEYKKLYVHLAHGRRRHKRGLRRDSRVSLLPTTSCTGSYLSLFSRI